MRRAGYRRAVGALCLMAMLVSSSCSEQEEAIPLQSGQEITFCLPGWTPMKHSRTTLFEEGGDLLDLAKGGRNFTLYAHVAGTGHTYINKARVWYHNDPKVLRWIFLDSKDEPITYYWPNSDALDFFAYMPDGRYNGKDGYTSKPSHVTVGPYTESDGQAFSCELPARADDNTSIQEFIYAYEPDKTMADNPVQLQFKHPFAIINFKVEAGSYRMTVDSIVFSKIHLNGTFSTARNEWTPNGDAQAYTAVIKKRIPNDVNYNTPLGEPFIVMPQSLKGAQLTLYAERFAGSGGTDVTYIKESFPFGDADRWEPGKKYTYIINYGDNKSEIYFDVKVVEDWIVIEEGNNIEVE